MKNKHIECDCCDPEHTLRITWDDEDKEWGTVMYIEVFLSDTIWWKRIWRGIKYIFGYKCRYGYFGDTELSGDRIKEIRDICNEFLEDTKLDWPKPTLRQSF